MRTEEQLKHLRFVMVNFYGPSALLLSDEEIDNWANQLEKGLQKRAIATWLIFVRLSDTNEPWDAIQHEPTTPTCSMYAIKEKCEELLRQHDTIKEFKIVNKDMPTEAFIVAQIA